MCVQYKTTQMYLHFDAVAHFDHAKRTHSGSDQRCRVNVAVSNILTERVLVLRSIVAHDRSMNAVVVDCACVETP